MGEAARGVARGRGGVAKEREGDGGRGSELEGEGGSDVGEKWRGIWKEEREFGDRRGEEEQNLYFSLTVKEEKKIETIN